MNDDHLIILAKRLWQAKIYCFAGLLIGLCAAFLVIYTATPRYEGSMTIGPANPMNGAEMSSLMANDDLFALRYMMQRVGMSASSDFTRFETMMKGHTVANLLLQSERIQKGLAPLFHQKILTAATLSDYLSKHIDSDPVGATSLRTITFEHPDAAFASYFLNVLHGVTDGLIQRTIKDGATQRVMYLRQAITETANPDHRRVLTTLLMEQERLKMLVTMDDDYAATLIEPPSVSAKPVYPNKPLLYSVFFMIGFVLGYMVFIIRHD